MMKVKNGFTLLELLVVVAIIGVLAAIAIPNVDSFINDEKQEVPVADYRYIVIDEDNKIYYCNEYDLASERPYMTDALVYQSEEWLKVRTYLFPVGCGVAVIDNSEWQPGLEDDESFKLQEY